MFTENRKSDSVKINSKTVSFLAAVLMIITIASGLFVSKTYANVVGVNPFAPTIEVFNEFNWTSVSSATLTMSGFTVTGAQSVTWNSTDLKFYAIVRVSSGARHLATVDPITGICTNIGQLSSTAFSTLTYSATTGTLYTMGGSGGPSGIAECLFSVDMTTAATTFLAGPFSVGTFGEVIAYNYDDGNIYHWSGQGMEKINTTTFAATTVTRSGASVDEVQGAVYKGTGEFVITDLIFLGATKAFTMTSGGFATLVSTTPYQVRGLGYEDPLLPVELTSFVSSVSGNNVTLNWTTASESNNSGFEIERSIVNGEWSKVGNVSGNGTTTVSNNYSFSDRNLASGNYNYRLKQIDFNGNFEYFNLSNEVNIGVPDNFELSQNYPNPFNPSTTINYSLPTDSKVNIRLFDMSGKEVATLVNEDKTAGYYSVNFNASSLSSGVYYYSINANNFTSTKKMMLIK